MDKKVENAVKNALTVVGALAVVKAAPVLAAGVAIGAVVTNPDKAKKAVEDFVGRVEENAEKWAEAARNAVEREAAPVTEAPAEEEPPVEEEVPASVEEEPAADLFEEAEPVSEEPEPQPVAPANDAKNEKLDKFLNALKELME